MVIFCILIIVAIGFTLLAGMLSDSRTLVKGLEAQLVVAAQDLEASKQQTKKVLSQKKSSEVRTGQIAEQMAPFLDGFPYDPKKSVFLGNPIDFVVFDESGVHFVEVKSGHSQLSGKQRMIRDLLLGGKTTFEVYRIKGE